MNLDTRHGNSNSDVKMSCLESDLVSKMLSWKLYELLSLIIPATETTEYKSNINL